VTGGPLGPERFAALMERLGGFERHPIVAVGVSGGADSQALALLVHEWASARGGSALALTVDHGLRSESAAEAASVAERMAGLDLRHAVLRWEGDKPASGIQDAARTARLSLLAERCREEGILHLALAHHRDDQAETVLMRLSRGSGVDGLAGMAPVRFDGDVRILRPLLGEPRESLRAVCRERGLPWIEDPSNANPAYARGRLRAAAGLLAAEGLKPERLTGTAGRAGRARAALEAATVAALARAAEFHPEGWIALDPEALGKAPEEIALRVLARAVEAVGGQAYAPRDDALGRLLAEVRGGLTRGRTLGGCMLAARRGAVVIAREPEAAADSALLVPGGTVFWDRRFVIHLDARHPEPLTVARLGEGGWRLAVEERGDLLRLEPPLAARLALPGLWSGSRLAGVPGFQGRYPGDGRRCPALAVFAPLVSAAGPPFPVV
jgi:tRNA(Ile)-lysidine synthase